LQNKNYTVSKAVKKAGIGLKATYRFNDRWKKNGEAILPGYKPALKIKRKGNNIKLTEEHS
jgi:transposase